MSIGPNTPIGPHAVAREIGRGEIGVVFLGRDVAIKALPGELNADPVRLARFEREAKLLAQINNSDVAGTLDTEGPDGRKHLILDDVAGETLADRLDEGPISVQDALDNAIGVANGIEAAHEAAVVHRDLKPANLRISFDGSVKVLDSGLAKPSEARLSSAILSDSATVTAHCDRSCRRAA